jgi:hypothetical protein
LQADRYRKSGNAEKLKLNKEAWEKRRAALGQAKLALSFQMSSQASLHGILKTHRFFALRLALLGQLCRRGLMADS